MKVLVKGFAYRKLENGFTLKQSVTKNSNNDYSSTKNMTTGTDQLDNMVYNNGA